MASRKFGPRSKAERKARNSNNKSEDQYDSNAQEIIPEKAADAKAVRRQQLQDELRASQGQMSSKKKKRLDKYIENKLKKEENVDLLKKLSHQKANVTGLQSSRNFGRKTQHTSDLISKSNIYDDGNGNGNGNGNSASSEEEGVEPESVSIVGSGLKRPLQRDVFGAPVISKRRRISLAPRSQRNFAALQSQLVNDDIKEASSSTSPSLQDDDSASESSWNGFSDGGREQEASRQPKTKRLSNAQSDAQPNAQSSNVSESHVSDSDDVDDDGTDDDCDLAASMFAALAKGKKPTYVGKDKSQVVKRDVSAFKEWATQQLNIARDFAPNRALDDHVATTATTTAAATSEGRHPKGQIVFEPRPPEQEEVPQELQTPNISSDRQAHTVLVERSKEMQESRSKLPVVAEEQKIMEAIHNNPVTIVCGATGSGKTTQIPQFLFEAGYGDPKGPTPGMIAVTQPRRVAAVTMARRVSQELGNHSRRVAYQIRYDTTVGRDTAIKFMTDGILVREIASDFKLSKYSVVVIDEAHERSVNTDILIGMLSRIAELRSDDHKEDPKKNRPLKLVIMSATLMAESFVGNSKLFRRSIPPMIQSEGRQYPVTMHFSRRTQRNYLDEALNKVLRGHKRLKPGAMLIFLTGENEIVSLSKKLHQALGKRNKWSNSRVSLAAKDVPLEVDDYDVTPSDRFTNDEGEEESDLDSGSDNGSDLEAPEDLAQPDDVEDERSDALILPLYSKLSTKEQLRVFDPVPKNTRLIILATNVAETSITIPGVRYVFDCGRSKEKVYNHDTGVQSFEIDWISKASAIQRAGRAGRTGPGHCYRLYSSAVYERDFEEYTTPEILRMPVEGVVMQLKSMDLQHVINFPFPTPPDKKQIARAEKLLTYLGAIDISGKATPLGRDLSIYPTSPRYARMLAIGHQHDCMMLTIATVAALATPELFMAESQLDSQDPDDEVEKKAYRQYQTLFAALDKTSDAIKLLAAFSAYAEAASKGQGDSFCKNYFIRPKAASEAYQLSRQLAHIVANNYPGLVNPSISIMPQPSQAQIDVLKKIVAVGFIDQVAIRADLLPSPPSLPKPRRAADVAYMTLFPSHNGKARESSGELVDAQQQAVYVHLSSVLAQRSVAEMPQYVIYSHLQQGMSKVRMHPLTSVSEADLVKLAKDTSLIEYGKPFGKIETIPGEPNKRTCWVIPSLVGRRGTVGWPLREQKVLQTRVKGLWQTVSHHN